MGPSRGFTLRSQAGPGAKTVHNHTQSIVRCLDSSKTFQHSACGGSKLWHVGLQLRGLICCMRGLGARRPTVARLLHLPVILTCRIPITGLAVLV